MRGASREGHVEVLGMFRYLYRGVSEEKYNEDGKGLRPYELGPFASGFKLDDGHYLDEGLTLDSSDDNSVIKHQKDSRRYPTSGIFTTPFFGRAKYYALHNGTRTKGYIYRIDRNLLAHHSVREFVVSEYAVDPKVPEDEEVILYVQNGNELPREVIVEAIEVHR
jgi:hypothetical protein